MYVNNSDLNHLRNNIIEAYIIARENDEFHLMELLDNTLETIQRIEREFIKKKQSLKI